MTDTERSDRTARNAAVLSVAEVVGKAGSLVYTILAARALEPDGYGAFAFAVAASLIVSSLAAWGFDELMMQRASTDPERLEDLAGQAVASKLLVGIPMFVLVGLVLLPSRPDAAAGTALLLVFAAALLDLLSDSGRATATVRERLTGVSVALVVNRIVTAGLAVAALLAGGGLVAISAAYLVGSAGGAAMTFVVVRRLGVRLRPRGRPRDAGRMLRGSWALGLSTVLGLILFRADAVILEAVRGDAAVGRYTVAYRLVENVLFVAWSVGRAAFPMLATAEGAGQVQRVLRRASGAVASVYAPFVIVALLRAGPVLELLFGDAYGDVAARSLQVLAATPLVFAVGYLLGQVLIARGDFVSALWVFGGAAAVNVAANLVMIPMFGEVGAATTTVLSYAAEAVFAWFVVRRRVGPTNPLASWSPALLGGVVMAGALLVLRAPLLVELALATAAYGLVWWAVARRRTPEQTDQVRRLVGRVIPAVR